MKIPNFMKMANISNIWKRKGDKINIDSYRGIFKGNIFRSLILRMIYQDKKTKKKEQLIPISTM